MVKCIVCFMMRITFVMTLVCNVTCIGLVIKIMLALISFLYAPQSSHRQI